MWGLLWHNIMWYACVMWKGDAINQCTNNVDYDIISWVYIKYVNVACICVSNQVLWCWWELKAQAALSKSHAWHGTLHDSNSHFSLSSMTNCCLFLFIFDCAYYDVWAISTYCVYWFVICGLSCVTD